MKQKMSDLCDVIFAGSSLKKADVREKSEVILYKVADIDNGLTKTHYASEEAFEKSKNKLQKYDLLLTVTGAIGRTGIVLDSDKALISSGIMCLRFKDNKRWLAEWFKRYFNAHVADLEKHKAGSVVPRISPTYIKGLIVDVPDINTIKRIVIKSMELEYYLSL